MALRQIDGNNILDSLTEFNLPVPEPLQRAVEIAYLCIDNIADPAPKLLELTDAQIVDHVSDLSVRWATRGAGNEPILRNALNRVADDAMEEAGAYLRAGGINEVISALRIPFDGAAAVLHKAAALGINRHTTAENVLDMASAEATEAWRSIPVAAATLNKIHEVRQLISETLECSPTKEQTRALIGANFFDNVRVNWTVCYAAKDNYHVEGTDPINWLDMAQTGLHLNTPAEIDAKYRRRAGRPMAPLLDHDGEVVTVGKPGDRKLARVSTRAAGPRPKA